MRVRIYYYFSFFAAAAIDFFLNSFFSRSLSESGYYEYATAISYLPLASTVVNGGMSYALLISDKEDINGQLLTTAQTSSLIIALIAMCIILVLLPLKGLGFCIFCFSVLLLSLANSSRQNVVSQLLNCRKYVAVSGVRFFSKAVVLVLCLAMVLIVGEISIFIYSFVELISILIVFFVFGFSVKIGLVKRTLVCLWKTSRFSFLSNGFSYLTMVAPILIYELFSVDRRIIVEFSIAFFVYRLLSFSLAPALQYLTAEVVHENKGGLFSFQRHNSKLILVVVFSFLISILAYMASPILIAFYDVTYSGFITLYQAFCAVLFLGIVQKVLGSVVSGLGFIQWISRVDFLGLLAVVLATVLAVALKNYTIVAIGFGVAITTKLIVYYLLLRAK